MAVMILDPYSEGVIGAMMGVPGCLSYTARSGEMAREKREMAPPSVSEAVIRANSSAEAVLRGRRGNVLQAAVEGSVPKPYRVSVTDDEGGIIVARCTCPYDGGGRCQHIVATRLAAAPGRRLLKGGAALDFRLRDRVRTTFNLGMAHLSGQDEPDHITGR